MNTRDTIRGTAHQVQPTRRENVQWGIVAVLSLLLGVLPALFVGACQ